MDRRERYEFLTKAVEKYLGMDPKLVSKKTQAIYAAIEKEIEGIPDPEKYAEAIFGAALYDTLLGSPSGECSKVFREYRETLKKFGEEGVRDVEDVPVELETVHLEEIDGQVLEYVLNSQVDGETASRILVNIARARYRALELAEGKTAELMKRLAEKCWRYLSEEERALVAAVAGKGVVGKLESVEEIKKFIELGISGNAALTYVPWKTVQKAMENLDEEEVYRLLQVCDEVPENLDRIPEKYLPEIASYIVKRGFEGKVDYAQEKGRKVWKLVNEFLIHLNEVDRVDRRFVQENPHYRWVLGHPQPLITREYPLPDVEFRDVPLLPKIERKNREVWLSYMWKYYLPLKLSTVYNVLDSLADGELNRKFFKLADQYGNETWFVTPHERDGVEVVEVGE